MKNQLHYMKKIHTFQNFKRLLKAPFIIYDDFASILKPATANKKDGPNSKRYQDKIVYGYGYRLIYADVQYSKPYKSYFGEDTINKFMTDTVNENIYCSKILHKNFDKPLAMNEKSYEDFESSTKCWIC